jgi:N-formylglutamate amidohydrolase
VIVNASFSHQHYAIAKDCLNHGYNVLNEKPFAKTVYECMDLIKTAKENGVIITAFHQSLYTPTLLKAKEILETYGSCRIIDLHSYSDEAVDRLFGYRNCPDVCIGIEPDCYDGELIDAIITICKKMALTTEINYPYKGSIVPNKFYGKKNTGIVSVMLEINKRVLGNRTSSPENRPYTMR